MLISIKVFCFSRGVRESNQKVKGKRMYTALLLMILNSSKNLNDGRDNLSYICIYIYDIEYYIIGRMNKHARCMSMDIYLKIC